MPTVVFPCAALYDPETGKAAIYSGGANTVTAIAFAKMDELIDFFVSTSDLSG